MSHTTETNRPSRRAPFGMPEELVLHLEAKGVTRKDLETMEFDDALKKAGPLDTKIMHRTLITVIKTSRRVDLLKSRLELLLNNPKLHSNNPLLQIVNTVMDAHGLDLCADASELLEFAWIRALESDGRAVKLISRFVIDQIDLSNEEVSAFIAEKWPSLFPMELLFSPAMKGHMAARLELLTAIAKKATEELAFWPQTLSLYKEIKEQYLPMEAVRAFGWAVLKTLKGQAAKEAFVQYTRAMKKKIFDFKYIQLFITLFTNSPADLQFLLYYVLTESRVGGSILCDVEVPHIPLPVFSEVFQRLSPEKINIRTTVPVIKNLIRREKKAGHLANLKEIEKWIVKLKDSLSSQPLEGILLNIHSICNPSNQQ